MQNQREIQLLKEKIMDVLKERCISVTNIYLFGSRAKGKSTDDSDWDLLIVLKEDINQEEKISLWKEIYKVLHQKFPGCPFDIIIKSEKTFNDEKYIVNTISNEAFKEGLQLHD